MTNMTFENFNDPRFIELERRARKMMRPLMTQKYKLRLNGMEPYAVMMPKDFDYPYVGEGATDYAGSFLGLPIVFGDGWGIVVKVPSAGVDER